jgi:hypothetical protein
MLKGGPVRPIEPNEIYPGVSRIMPKNAKESEANEVLPKITEAVWGFENRK